MSVPAAAAPRAIATSPSSCAICWNAIGATRAGIETGVPSTVVSRRDRRDVDENARPEPETRERLAVPAKRPLVARAADDVAPGLGRDGLLGQPLGVVDREELLHGRGSLSPRCERQFTPA